jgi:hypothetical protein
MCEKIFSFCSSVAAEKRVTPGKKFGGGFLHGWNAALIHGQRFAEERFQGAIDEIDDAGFARARGGIGRDDAGGEGFDLARLVGGENFERGITGPCGLVGVFSGGNDRGPVGGEPGCACGTSKKLQKIAASRMERVHVPPVVHPIYELRAMASTRNPGALLLIWPV